MFKEGVLLSDYSNYKIGGPARFFFIAHDVDQLIAAIKQAKKDNLSIFILGGGTNLLIDDGGFDGLVVKPEVMKLESNEVTKSNGVMGPPARLAEAMAKRAGEAGNEVMVKVGAGVSVETLLHYCITHNLSGLEWAGGLPGTVGGAIRGNAGAFKGEIKDAITEVISMDIAGAEPRIIHRDHQQCAFGYRDSIFKRHDGGEIILEATLKLTKGDPKIIQQAIAEKIKYRQERQPLEYPNIGSTFKNVPLSRISANQDPNTHEYYIRVHSRDLNSSKLVLPVKTDPFPVVPAAYLIDQAGLKGTTRGGAMISPKHPNFIINVSKASSGDVKELIKLMKLEVKNKFGIELEEEIIYV